MTCTPTSTSTLTSSKRWAAAGWRLVGVGWRLVRRLGGWEACGAGLSQSTRAVRWRWERVCRAGAGGWSSQQLGAPATAAAPANLLPPCPRPPALPTHQPAPCRPPPPAQHDLAPGGRSGAVAFSAAAASTDARLAAAAAAAASSSISNTSSRITSSGGGGRPGGAGFVDAEVAALAARLQSYRRFSALFKTGLDPLASGW